MTLLAIGLMILAALGARLFRAERLNALLIISVIAIFALQTSEPVLPTATLILVVGVWWIVNTVPTSQDYRLMLMFAGVACIASGLIATRLMFASGAVMLSVAVVGVVGVGAAVPRAAPDLAEDVVRRRLALAFVGLIIVLLVVVKLPALQDTVTAAASQVVQTQTALGWQWLGFSYIAFRLMHILLDYRSGRLKALGALGLRDFALYVIFFPALPAGPIDRIEHFSRELAGSADSERTAQIANGALRLGVGLFKKFILADGLAYVALAPDLVAQANRGLPVTMWLMVYAYAFRILFDFSGYTDIAIGIGLLAGIRLPENFISPYSQRNIAAFWNNWHITLSTWFRNYFFTPLSRWLVSKRLNRWLIIFIAQVSTMILIGLWHGMALNFVLWGAWHGVGLWAHRWIVDHSRGWDEYVQARPRLATAVHGLSILVTFHFVAIGWIFFALPDPQLIVKALAALVGLRA